MFASGETICRAAAGADWYRRCSCTGAGEPGLEELLELEWAKRANIDVLERAGENGYREAKDGV